MNLDILRSYSHYSSVVALVMIFAISPLNLSNLILPLICLYLLFQYAVIYDQCKVTFHNIDIPLYLFVLITILTCFSTTDLNLSISSIIYFLSMISWIMLLKWDKSFGSKLHVILNYIFIFNLVYVSIVFLFYHNELLLNNSWDAFFGSNKNYTITSLILLLPFFLFKRHKNKIDKIFVLIALLILTYLLYLTNARGAIIAFIILLVFRSAFIFKKFSLAKAIFCLLFPILSVAIFCFFKFDFMYQIPIINEFGRSGDLTRLYMMKSSIQLFFENFITGVGIGNWHIFGYKFDYSNVEGYSVVNGFTKSIDHNYFTRILAETGFFGFIFYTSSLFLLFVNYLKNSAKLSDVELAWFSIVILYSILSLFYLSANSSPYFFSGVQFLYFTAIGILCYRLLPRYSYSSKFLKYIIIIVLLFSLLFSTADEYLNIKIRKSINQSRSININNNNMDLLWKSSMGYNYLIPYERGKLQLENKDISKAELHFKEALQLRPYNSNLSLDYAELLIQDNRKDLAKVYLDRVFTCNRKLPRVNELYSRYYTGIDCNLYNQFRGLSSSVNNEPIKCEDISLSKNGEISFVHRSSVVDSSEYICKNKTTSWTNFAANSLEYLDILNDGAIEFQVLFDNNTRVFGFTNNPTNVGHHTIDYGITLTSNNDLYIWNCGEWIGRFGKYEIGDLIKIKRQSSKVFYYKNDSLFYSSKYPSSKRLNVMVNIYENEGCMEQISYNFDNFDYTSHVEFDVLR